MIAPVTDWGRNKAVVRNPDPSGVPLDLKWTLRTGVCWRDQLMAPTPERRGFASVASLGRGEQRLRAGLPY
jgi:hypothetical protein